MIRRVMITSLFAILGCALSLPAEAQMCRESDVGGRIKSDESFRLEVGAGMVVRVDPLKDGKGWWVKVSSKDSTEDWARPANLPFESENAQYLGRGHDYTTREQLRLSHRIYFPATEADYNRLRELADIAKKKSDGAELMSALHPMRAPLVEITPEDFDRKKPNDVGWMRFRARVVVPEGFPVSPTMSWRVVKCPERD